MNIFAYRDYKALIRDQLNRLKQRDKQINLRWLSSEVRVQYTYLSRVLNNDGIDLNERHLYQICRLLKLNSGETDFVLLLRQMAVSEDPELQQFHLDKVERISEENKVDATVKSFDPQNSQSASDYLLDPYAVVILAALSIPAIFKKPHLLMATLGLTEEQIQERLRILERIGFVELNKSGKTVEKILENKTHFNADHPLMRPHQYILRGLCLTQMMKLRETSKTSFMATFSGSEALYQEVKAEFKNFVNKVQQLSQKGSDQKVYQLNFDFFTWL